MATVKYKMVNMSHPWDEKRRKDGVKAWCLCEVVEPELGLSTIFEPIAIFNLDSAAERFAAHCYLGQTVEVGDDFAELFASLQRSSSMNLAERIVQSEKLPFCSFCNRNGLELGSEHSIIQGPREDLYICDDCVSLAAEIVAEARKQKGAPGKRE